MKEARFNMIRRRQWQEEGAHFYYEFQRKTYSRSLADPDDTRNGNNKKNQAKGKCLRSELVGWVDKRRNNDRIIYFDGFLSPRRLGTEPLINKQARIERQKKKFS